MFITVMFGAGCRVLVNPWCSLVTFIKHLKQKAQLPPEVTIALLAEDGHLVSLEEEIAQAPSMACSLLQEQGTYILVQVISKWAAKGKDGTPTHYESLLDNLDDQCPELAGANRQRSSDTPLSESGITKKLHQQEGKGHRQDARAPPPQHIPVQGKGSKDKNKKSEGQMSRWRRQQTPLEVSGAKALGHLQMSHPSPLLRDPQSNLSLASHMQIIAGFLPPSPEVQGQPRVTQQEIFSLYKRVCARAHTRTHTRYSTLMRHPFAHLS
ncbi:uncharacterized protein C22orf15 homolog isoform X5 [Mesocricetus auratus]|uniref:Uncharacterized protein C22orf15 homolog isoform X5 n=1 Tax=Mesocricetus auratus TaxID=10036 RepID=A0ABM2WBE7_MESAU|nr:uncharacterized protein C22orf15 homolog isoform X5 [Mesocricetus auratus]